MAGRQFRGSWKKRAWVSYTPVICITTSVSSKFRCHWCSIPRRTCSRNNVFFLIQQTLTKWKPNNGPRVLSCVPNINPLNGIVKKIQSWFFWYLLNHILKCFIPKANNISHINNSQEATFSHFALWGLWCEHKIVQSKMLEGHSNLCLMDLSFSYFDIPVNDSQE